MRLTITLPCSGLGEAWIVVSFESSIVARNVIDVKIGITRVGSGMVKSTNQSIPPQVNSDGSSSGMLFKPKNMLTKIGIWTSGNFKERSGLHSYFEKRAFAAG